MCDPSEDDPDFIEHTDRMQDWFFAALFAAGGFGAVATAIYFGPNGLTLLGLIAMAPAIIHTIHRENTHGKNI
jgi:hypothetical protein